MNENILPSILDRFLEEDIRGSVEINLRDSVRRDLQWLLNTRTLDSSNKLVNEYHEVKRSTINFGTKDYSGIANGKVSIGDVAKMVEEAIINFEPRIIPETLSVITTNSTGDPTHGLDQLTKDELSNIIEKGSFDFIIRGAICADPHPLEFQYKTALGISKGNFSLS